VAERAGARAQCANDGLSTLSIGRLCVLSVDA
jgi:hypothetical protein